MYKWTHGVQTHVGQVSLYQHYKNSDNCNFITTIITLALWVYFTITIAQHCSLSAIRIK